MNYSPLIDSTLKRLPKKVDDFEKENFPFRLQSAVNPRKPDTKFISSTFRLYGAYYIFIITSKNNFLIEHDRIMINENVYDITVQ